MKKAKKELKELKGAEGAAPVSDEKSSEDAKEEGNEA